MFCFTDKILYSNMYFINNFAYVSQTNNLNFEYVNLYTYFHK